MKKCDYFKDLILTSYMDGQLTQAAKEKVEGHLLDCSDCRVFFKEVQRTAIAPFKQAIPQAVPVILWDNIKQGLEEEKPLISPWEGLVEKLKELIFVPRFVPVFASLVLMFLVGTVSFNMIQVQKAQDRDQGEYLVSLLSPTASASSDNNDPASPIEHYFL